MQVMPRPNSSEELLLEIYSFLLDEIFDNPAPKIFLYGGRGLGKSTLLRILSRRLEEIDPTAACLSQARRSDTP